MTGGCSIFDDDAEVEIEATLGSSATVMPVLIDDAELPPPDELAGPLRGLVSNPSARLPRGVRVLPLIASSSYFADSDLARFQSVNARDRPLDLLSKGEQEAVLESLHRSVRSLLAAGT